MPALFSWLLWTLFFLELLSENTEQPSGVLAGLTACVHIGHHDNTLVVANGSVVLSVVHMEHVYEKRGFHVSLNPQQAEVQWNRSWGVAVAGADLTLNEVPTRIHALGVTAVNKHKKKSLLPVTKVLRPGRTHKCKHQHSHATYGFYDSPFATAIVLSYDGGGADGSFNIFLAHRHNSSVRQLSMEHLCIACAIYSMSLVVPNISTPVKCRSVTRISDPRCAITAVARTMALGALGRAREKWRAATTKMVETASWEHFSALSSQALTDAQDKCDFAATFYDVLAQAVARRIRAHANHLHNVEGLVLTGGIAFNILANTLIRRRLNVRTHVCLAPNDGGLPVGCCLALRPPVALQDLRYRGIPLLDAHREAALASQFGARRHTIAMVAGLLHEGQVLGVLRGRQEVGVRALGHRALLMSPSAPDARARLNRLKGRPEWMPVGAVVAREHFANLSSDPDSFATPYPSFIAALQPEVQARLPALSFAGGCRLQTLEHRQDPWLYDLLQAVGARTGTPASPYPYPIPRPRLTPPPP